MVISRAFWSTLQSPPFNLTNNIKWAPTVAKGESKTYLQIPQAQLGKQAFGHRVLVQCLQNSVYEITIHNNNKKENL